jgi:hypothetical protein
VSTREGEGAVYHDVVVVAWPAERSEVERLARMGVPRLLLVDESEDPPVVGDVLEDWLRMPADERDVRARINVLRHRADTVRVVPFVDEHGRLFYRGRWVSLGRSIERLARLFVERFDDVVTDGDLKAQGWAAEELGSTSFRGQLHRFRKRVSSLGLELRLVRGGGHVLSDAEGVPAFV